MKSSNFGNACLSLDVESLQMYNIKNVKISLIINIDIFSKCEDIHTYEKNYQNVIELHINYFK